MGAPVLAAMRGHRVSGVNVARVLDLAKAELLWGRYRRGLFFVMAGFLMLARAILVRRATGKWLLLAGLMFGLAVGCRPHLVVVCGIVLGLLLSGQDAALDL